MSGRACLVPMVPIAAVALLAALAFAQSFDLAPLAAVGILAAAVLVRWPVLGLLMIVVAEAFLPLRQPISALGGLTVPKMIGLLIFPLAVMGLLTGRTALSHLGDRAWWAVLGLCSIPLMNIVLGGSGPAADMLMDLASALILFTLILIYRDAIDLDWFARCLAGALAVACLLQFFIDTSHPENGRPSGFSGDPNIFAILLVMALPMTVYLAINEKHILLRAGWGLAALLQASAMIGTLSRSGGLVAMAVLCAGAVYVWPFVKRRHVIGLLGAGVAGVAVFAAAMPQSFVERMESLQDFSFTVQDSQDRSLGRRAAYWIVGVRMVADKPLFGEGAGSYPGYFARSEFAAAFQSQWEEESYFRRAHNTYLELAAELGLVGLGFWLAVVVIGLMHLRAARRMALVRGAGAEFAQAVAFSLSFLAAALGLFFYSAPDDKIFWALLAAAIVLKGRLAALPVDENTVGEVR